MYQYSTIKAFMKEWTKYKEQEITNNDLTILTFYAQEQYKRYHNEQKLFETYTEREIDFNWNTINEYDSKFLVKVWNTYYPIIKNGEMNVYVANEINYNLIEEMI